jgi:hypothetical protein
MCRWWKLDLLEPVAGLHVEEVIEETVIAGDVRRLRSLRRVVEESQRIERPLPRPRAPTYHALDPTGYAVSANPIAATGELFVGQRSGVSPLFGSDRSQNQLKVRRWRCRGTVCLTVSADGGIGPVIPVIDVADVRGGDGYRNDA